MGGLFAEPPAGTGVFLGAQAFISPNVYNDLQLVPTWSNLEVQAMVEARLLSGE
jgi:predicted FMN-binding regulatory protein PaiB